MEFHGQGIWNGQTPFGSKLTHRKQSAVKLLGT